MDGWTETSFPRVPVCEGWCERWQDGQFRYKIGGEGCDEKRHEHLDAGGRKRRLLSVHVDLFNAGKLPVDRGNALS